MDVQDLLNSRIEVIGPDAVQPIFVWFEILTAVLWRIAVFWDLRHIFSYVGTNVLEHCAASDFRIEEETAPASETLVPVYQTTGRHIRQESSLKFHSRRFVF
jgi:hypothetical protein